MSWSESASSPPPLFSIHAPSPPFSILGGSEHLIIVVGTMKSMNPPSPFFSLFLFQTPSAILPSYFPFLLLSVCLRPSSRPIMQFAADFFSPSAFINIYSFPPSLLGLAVADRKSLSLSLPIFSSLFFRPHPYLLSQPSPPRDASLTQTNRSTRNSPPFFHHYF